MGGCDGDGSGDGGVYAVSILQTPKRHTCHEIQVERSRDPGFEINKV